MVPRETLYPLVLEAKAGSRPAMEQLLVAVRPLLEKVASDYADPRHASQSTSDLVQEAWLRAWLKLDQFSSDEPNAAAGAQFLAWVEKIVKTVGLNAVRERQTQRRSPRGSILPLDGGEESGARLALAADGSSPSARLHEEDRTRVLREAIDRIEEETDRVILRIRLFEGLTLKRVAERLEMEYSQVKARYRSGIQRLERFLREKL